MNKRGTFNIEILVTLLLFLIIFAMIISLSIEEFSSIEETQNRKESRIITSEISEIINKVYQNGEGYSIKYKLPSKINKETYILKINNTGVYVNSHYQITYSKIISTKILNQKQYYLEPGNVYRFTNINNSITIIQDI